MVGRTLLMLSLLASLSLSGCLGDEAGGEEETESLDAAPPAEPAPGERKAAVEAGEVTPVAEPFSWDGAVGSNIFACAAVTCTGQSLGDWDNTHEASGIVSGDVRLTWDTPNELAFGLATRCDGACDFVTYDSGGSPLTLSFSELDPDHEYLLVVWHPYHGATSDAGAQAGPQGSFQVEGTLMTVPAA